ncbi:Riboflavin kinase domain bacterial/eukaryotic [Neofusicoccum parvum]|uniref:Riboflavin kinase domain bacterial/eukaryotic n=1 Tax=Neofusicoccum parvum TaxID=310453 RepID=A0ACB5SMX0_9PEZI|nr:Riboflavin kinase domain bacterial/eukaryotic [Neofusicoccum parvum]GME57535.1 Riboflavin kinase domain bacterial/eukaryotic [Neofusicoccum parvum]
MAAATDFQPARFLQPVAQGPATQVQDPHQEQDWRRKPALLILNQPVASVDLLMRLWPHTGFRLCADGGANRLYDTFDGVDDAPARREEFLPSVIHGDLDSLRDDVRAYYQAHGVRISRDPDQYSTDFGKAVKQIAAAAPPSPQASGGGASCREILILCTLGGRVDQGLGLLYEMLRIQNARPDTRLWLFSESSVSFILPPGESRVAAPVASAAPGTDGTPLARGFFTENVGILPAFGPATISTTGLEWDVTDWPTSVDGNVSTSNHVKGEYVTVKTDAKVLFTIERATSLP